MNEKLANYTIGVDLGDKQNIICVLDSDGDVLELTKVSNTRKGMQKFFHNYPKSLVALENGSHSPWVNRLLQEMGFRVLVGNARKLSFIWQSEVKTDYRDAEMLARIAKFDSKLLHPIKHRSYEAQADLAVIKARDMLVSSRADLINHIRGTLKTAGERIPKCSAPSFHKKAKEHIPEELKNAILPLLDQLQKLTETIKDYDKHINKMSQDKYPETEVLKQVQGVGPVTALTFVLTLENKERIQKSRNVGPMLGLTPRRDQSGDLDKKQLPITKCGNKYLRQLLVGCAHYILGAFGEDSDLRRYGLRICEHGGKTAKKKAVVAVARKLAVLLHRLWVTGEVYDPLYNQKTKKAA